MHPSTFSPGRVCVAAITLLAIAILKTGPVHSQEPLAIVIPKPGDRIQLNMWTDSKLGIKDPLTQVVHVTRPGTGGGGTGFLMANCRIMTAVHVIAGSFSGTRSDMESADRDQFVGERLAFETQPVPWLDGKRVTGSFVVVAHGNMNADGRPTAGDQQDGDWAVGYDEACTADKYRLGIIEPFMTSSLDGKGLNLASAMARQIAASKLEGRRFISAGYPSLTAPGLTPRTYPLYIDSDCAISPSSGDHDLDVYEFFAHSIIRTTCSSSYGGSGSPVMQVVMNEAGGVARDANGRPRLEAVGIIVRKSRYKDPAAPFSQTSAESVAFTSRLRATLRPYLTMRWSPEIHAALQKIVVEREHESAIDLRIQKNFASMPRGADAPAGLPGTALSQCAQLPVKDVLAQARVCTDILSGEGLTQSLVLQVLRHRGVTRRQGGQFGQSLRDLNMGMRFVRTLKDVDVTLMRYHAELAETYHLLEQPYAASRHYEDALNVLYGLKQPSPIAKLDLVKRRAHVYDEAHQFDLAVGDYGLVLASVTADAEVWNGRCYAAASSSNATRATLDRALEDCNQALKLKPGAAHILDSRAFVHMRAGRYEAAVADYTAALKVDPKMTSALYGRATAKDKLGDAAGYKQDIAVYRDQNDWYSTFTELKSRGLFTVVK